MNSLFVLSKSEDTLESLMTRLKVNKNELINMMIQTLSENVNDFQQFKLSGERF